MVVGIFSQNQNSNLEYLQERIIITKINKIEKNTQQLELNQPQIISLMSQINTNGQSLVSQQDNQQQQTLLSKDQRFDSLDKVKIWAYGVGHFINDLVAACWFNFLFYYLKRVVQTPASNAALLSGQICDGIATPIVGYISDKYNTRWGQRTPWYIFGLVLVIVCYVPIYQGFRSPDNRGAQYAYYTIFPGLFNVGWAALQISHMSLVPSLTCSRKRRVFFQQQCKDKLNNLRNTFTFISNFLVLGMGVIIFALMSDKFWQYRIISFVVAGIGLAASIFFVTNIKQTTLSKACHEKAQKLKQQIAQRKNINRSRLNSATEFSQDQEGNQVHQSKRLVKAQTIKDWFKMPKFYFFGICYMGVRLYVNMFGTFLPFYLEGVIKLGKQNTSQSQVPFQVALVPLIVYLSSTVASWYLDKFYQMFGRKKALFIGTIICCISLGSMLLIDQSTNWVIYILAIFIGCSQTMVLSTGINFISDVVGTKAKTGAFVFGCYSLLDKFSAGIVIYLVGSTQPYEAKPNELNGDQVNFIKYTIILIPALSCVLASLIVLSYPIKQYSKQKKNISNLHRDSLQEELVV